MAVIYTLQYLLNAMGRVGFAVELPGHDVFEQLATRYAANKTNICFVKYFQGKKESIRKLVGILNAIPTDDGL